MPNKTLEQLYLEQFKECLPDFPAGQIVGWESPDFLIRNSTTYGIELKNVYRPSTAGMRPLQAQESWEDEILRQAQILCETIAAPPLTVCVQFTNDFALAKGDIPQLSFEMAELIRRTVSKYPRARIYNNWPFNQLPRGVESIFASKSLSFLGNSWQVVRGGSMHRLSPNDVQALIDTKNSRCEAYRKVCDQVWLVLIATMDAPSRYVELTPDAAAHRYTSRFDRLFYFDAFRGNVTRLSP